MKSKNHLNKEIRSIIEESLDKYYSFTKISKIIYKDRRTISRDILKHRIKKISPDDVCRKSRLLKK